MKRKESKIPLLLAFIVLGYFVFWAIGYVNRNKPAIPEQPPIQAMAKEPEPTPQPQPQQQVVDNATPQQPAPSQSQTPQPQLLPDQVIAPSGEAAVGDDSNDNGRTLRNPKIGGIVRETTGRH